MNSAVARVLRTKPDSKEKLALWVQAFLGFKLHDQCRCVPQSVAEQEKWEQEKRQPHDCQLDIVWEAFTNQFSSAVVLACRGAGKSFAVASLCVIDAWFKPNLKACVSAFVRFQADYIFGYIKNFLNHMAMVMETKNPPWKVKRSVIEFDNGSVIRFYSGGKSEANVQGFHPHTLYIDEADKFGKETFDGISNGMESQPGIPSRFMVLSTNYSLQGDGIIVKQIERYEQFNLTKPDYEPPRKIYRTCLIDILEKCGDKHQCHNPTTNVTCPLWKYCKGRAKEGSGFISISEAIGKMVNSSIQTFESQMMLLRPTSEYAIFPRFGVSEHVMDPEIEWNPKLDTYLCFDPGGKRCCHAALLVQREPHDPQSKEPTPQYKVIDEFTTFGNIELLIEKIKLKYPDACKVAQCFCDPQAGKKDMMKGAVSFKHVLRQHGFACRTMPVKRKPTFEMLKTLIEPASGPPKFVVNKRCVNLIRQIMTAEYVVFAGQATGEPADRKGDDDLLDCARYIIYMTRAFAKPIANHCWFHG